jgi:hypothetical protein
MSWSWHSCVPVVSIVNTIRMSWTANTFNHMQTVLTVLPAKELDLVKARELASRLKRRGLIADWQPLVEAKGIKIILKLDTSPRRRSAIADEFVQVGYEVHDDI